MCHRWVKSLLSFVIFSLYLSGTACAVPNTQYEESFDIVWDTINERFYDTNFNGVNWADSCKRFHSLVVHAESDGEFYTQINLMLFELDVSHLGVVPSDDTRQLEEAAIFCEGTAGVDARFVDGKLLITSVEVGSTAHQHGLAPGYEILSLNGQTIVFICVQKCTTKVPYLHPILPHV